MAILKAAAEANFLLDNMVDTLITGLTFGESPPAGDYLLWATIQMRAPGTTTDDEFIRFNVFVGGVLVPHTERSYEQDASITDAAWTYVIGAIVSLNGSQSVEIRHRATTSSFGHAAQARELTLFPVQAAPPIEVSATGDTTTVSTSFAALMTATTPAAGTYVCTFGTSGVGPGGNEVEFRVVVGGVVVAHSIRAMETEASATVDQVNGSLAVVVTPDGAEDVVIEWRLTAAVGTRTIHQRTMTLTPSAAADVKEASSVADDSDSTASPAVLIDGMTITDPGAEDYLVLFTGYDFYGVIGTGDAETFYTIHENGAIVVGTGRFHDHEGSLDSVNMNVQAGGRVTVTSATSDLEMFWENPGGTATRTIHHRTMVAIREARPLHPRQLVRQAFGTPRARPGAYAFLAAPVLPPAVGPPVTHTGFMVVMGVERFPRTRQQGWSAHAPGAGMFSLTPLPGVATGFVGTRFLR